MMIVPCRRAFVLQCSSLPSMAYLRLPLACPILLTVVLAPLASAWTSSDLPVPIVPPATPLPLAPRSGTPCAMHVCELPSMTIQGGAAHMLKLNGTSTCSLGESMDLKHAADLEAPPDVPVWDDLPHLPARPVTPSAPARPAGPCLSDSDLCTTDSCSSLGPERPNQASCAACACRAHPAAPCTIPRTPTATRPSTLYENEAYFQPSDNLCLPPSQIGQDIARTVPKNGQPLPPLICSEVPPSASPPPLPPQSLPSPPSSPPGLSQLPWARLLPQGLPQPPLVPPPPSPPQPRLPAPRLSPSPSSSPPRLPPALPSPPWLPQSPPPQQLSPLPSSSARPPTEPFCSGCLGPWRPSCLPCLPRALRCAWGCWDSTSLVTVRPYEHSGIWYGQPC